ncbi:MAG: DNA adenine methylase [Acidobacteria bacterium]|nr:DNA adenine methylase [Acidobacteriota bacterium]MBI3425295.1 DNA adenine methylase [Acidobacteriota bacterium]
MQALALFDDLVVTVPKTEGIKYAGSKLKLLPHLLSLVQQVNPKTVFDGFAGTTRVSQALAQSGYTVIANDLAVWSEVFATCYLLNDYPAAHYKRLIDHLNQLPPEDGWFTELYGGDASEVSSTSQDGLKKPWQSHNTRRLDAIRNEIDGLALSNAERAVLLTSLILALDEVDSTLGHYAAYLNEWSPRSYNRLRLKVPQLIPKRAAHSVHRQDVFELLADVEADLAYFDPPYGSNNEKMPPSRVRYAAYYHLWTTVCLNDRPPVFGKAKRRADTSDVVAPSVFEEFRCDANGHFIALDAIERLLKLTKAKHIILSYSSGGRATAAGLNNAISAAGRLVDVIEVDYRKNVMAGMRWTNEWVREAEAPNREFLFLIEK